MTLTTARSAKAGRAVGFCRRDATVYHREMASTKACFFCDLPAKYHPNKASVCQECAHVVGALAARVDRPVWTFVWNGDEVSMGSSQTQGRDSEIESTLEGFRAGIAAQISPDDGASHFNLACAYLEMGLRADAVRELAIVMRSEIEDLRADALRMLLTKPLLKDDGLDVLRKHIAAN